ncbi:CLIP domain-containing serine protease B15-like isoform X2 [Leptidea sinapis]|uniref:CLIP domain-containing serine protease B15-like isoform X2 n=1 Tax=Leptidea sinapis TaxID=189913 RepID=UPI0021C42122|nr:CLIP domain-containing serine protease B15-like isoform X2 [Leptidea sinapis]
MPKYLLNRTKLILTCSSGDVLQFGCDKSNAVLNEGNVGENGALPWLGVLRVHVHITGKDPRIGLTGILLVKANYAISNADDVAKIPKYILRSDSKAMFIATNNTPWYCGVKDLMLHPEYDVSNPNTIALIELATNIYEAPNLNSICWPYQQYNASSNLYAIGFTDENKLLEKVIYKMQFVNRNMCDEFYNKIGVPKEIYPRYQCGYATNNKNNCKWDNGMILASNSTGHWTGIGFGIQGPGCSAPARFIELYPYLSWIDSATDEIPA